MSLPSSSSSLRSRPANSGTRRSDSVGSALTAIDSSSARERAITIPHLWSDAGAASLPRRAGEGATNELAASNGPRELHLQLFHARAEILELLLREDLLDLGEELVLLLTDVVHDVLFEHLEGGAPDLSGLVRLLEVRQDDLDLLVLLDRLEHQVARRLGLFGGGIEDLLLDLGVNAQLPVQLWKELLAGFLLLHLGEELLDLLVFLLQSFDSVHIRLLHVVLY